MDLVVIIGHQYGQKVILPACDDSRAFCELCNTKTLTPKMIDIIKRLGYKIHVEPTEPKEL